MIDTPYGDLDQNIVGLVKVINSFPGIFTVGSCGGHADPESYQCPEGSWDIVFQLEVEEDRPTAKAWLSFEFLIYAFNNWFYRSGQKVYIGAYSAPPHFNVPGRTITLRAGGMVDPAKLSTELLDLKQECFH